MKEFLRMAVDKSLLLIYVCILTQFRSLKSPGLSQYTFKIEDNKNSLSSEILW